VGTKVRHLQKMVAEKPQRVVRLIFASRACLTLLARALA
jgi:hypothetical protein